MTRDRDRAVFWDEPMFWHLLAIEAVRARRAGREFLILIADVLGTTGSARRKVRIPELARALAGCLRETDLVGWHRTDSMAGAILTEIDSDPEVARLVGDKVFRILGAGLPAEVARGLRVRVYRYGVSGDRSFHRVFSTPGAGAAMKASSRPGIAQPRAAQMVGWSQPGGTHLPQHAGAP